MSRHQRPDEVIDVEFTELDPTTGKAISKRSAAPTQSLATHDSLLTAPTSRFAALARAELDASYAPGSVRKLWEERKLNKDIKRHLAQVNEILKTADLRRIEFEVNLPLEIRRAEVEERKRRSMIQWDMDVAFDDSERRANANQARTLELMREQSIARRTEASEEYSRQIETDERQERYRAAEHQRQRERSADDYDFQVKLASLQAKWERTRLTAQHEYELENQLMTVAAKQMANDPSADPIIVNRRIREEVSAIFDDPNMPEDQKHVHIKYLLGNIGKIIDASRARDV